VNIGTGAARNSAIEHAKGKFLFYMDSDDEITPDCIQLLVEKMIETDMDIICGSYNRIEGNDISYFTGFHVPLWNKLYKRSFLRQHDIKCIPSHLMEDVYFYVQILVHTHRFLVIPNITYYYHIQIHIPPKEWGERIYNDWRQVPLDSFHLLNHSSTDMQTRIKLRKKIFWISMGVSGMALKSSYSVQHYINDYLNPKFYKNKDTMHSWALMMAYMISCMPLGIKKMLLALHVKFFMK
jgi:glycosyltransferase involved in cell wall biosynthesis